MDLMQVLGMLQHVTGPNASGEYTAKCPAHQDRTASLTACSKVSQKDGRERVYLCCHAGCQSSEIMAALGITAKDLVVDPDPARPAAGSQRRKGNAAKTQRRGMPTDADTPAEEAAVETAVDPETGEVIRDRNGNPIRVHTVGTGGADGRGSGSGGAGGRGSGGAGAEKEGPKIDFGHPDKVYSYTDEHGKELFQVCRYQYTDAEGKPQKTFRQRMRATEEMRRANPDLKVNRDGFVASVPAEIRDTTLYRLPEVVRAIAEGKPVYVVEGEKDADTLCRLGFTATCNPGGAGKWRDGYSARLAGADVIILPDSDTKDNGYTGQNHAYDVAVKLQGVAKRVRLIDIKEACPELPPKGDISDMVAILGDVPAMDTLARQVAATGDFDPQAVPFWLTPMEQAERLYATVAGYGARGGCICQISGSEIKPLTDFVVLPREELEKDDGVSSVKYFALDGFSRRGAKLKRVVIPAEELDSMNWVTKAWGFDAALVPGNTVKAKVSWAIKQVGQTTARRITEYTHTGWRKIGGKYAYLYHGGAIGMDGVTVDMGDALSTYRLDGSGAEGFDRIPYADAARESLKLKDVMKADVGVALLGTAYLAPLREFLSQSDIVPAFALFLHGGTGTHKSTAAALAMAHFGNFHAKNPPASFNDTGNQIRLKAFLVKDMPILVDDFHPTKSLQEKRQMSAIAQTLSRAFGDGSDRGRLNADRSLQSSRPPRSVAIITGEDLPDIGASGLARYFVVDVDEGDVPVSGELTRLQEMARQGCLQRAMRGYILWLSKQIDELPERLREMFLKYREDIRTRSQGAHDRAPEAVACIMIGYSMMLNYFRDVGLFDTAEAVTLLAQARDLLVQASEAQTRELESEKPSRIYLNCLAELLSSKQAGVQDLTVPDAKDFPPTIRKIGYVDGEYYYLLPEVAFGMVQQLCRQQGTEFPVTLRGLYKALKADGIIQGSGKAITRGKWINGRTERLLWIPVDKLDGPKPEQKQTKMTEVSGVEIPEEWK